MVGTLGGPQGHVIWSSEKKIIYNKKFLFFDTNVGQDE